MIDVKTYTRYEHFLVAINKAIGYRTENDDTDASARALACLQQACTEIAHINNDSLRAGILDSLEETAREMVAKTRVLILNPPKDH